MMVVHHDHAVREYAYEPKSKGGTFTQVLFDQAKNQGRTDISFRNCFGFRDSNFGFGCRFRVFDISSA
jgi:hypothetical protein